MIKLIFNIMHYEMPIEILTYCGISFALGIVALYILYKRGRSILRDIIENTKGNTTL